MSITKIEVNSRDTLDELYKASAFTAIGVPSSDVDDFINIYLGQNEDDANAEPECGGFASDKVTVYLFDGELMNNIYKLTGDNKYSNDLHFVSIKLDQFKNIGKLATFRMVTNPQRMKWFDDIVDNNKRREGM